MKDETMNRNEFCFFFHFESANFAIPFITTYFIIFQEAELSRKMLTFFLHLLGYRVHRPLYKMYNLPVLPGTNRTIVLPGIRIFGPD